jgi:haloacetate dehalogenase
MDFFEEFELRMVDLGNVVLRVRSAGAGQPIVLLHGHPRTHVTWNRVAPLLAEHCTVVCPDLRGYGKSTKVPSAPDHAPYSKRAMAGDVLALMRSLGHARFAVVGHDRGAYVAQRLALDHPESVSALVILDAVPIGEALARADADFAAKWWHWFFFGQTDKPAERVIDADPDAWYQVDAEHMGEAAYADLREALHDPRVVHAMLEDYRAGLGIDREHDDADRAAGRLIRCPTLLVWASEDDMEELYGDPVAIWSAWAVDLRGERIESGHHIAEEAPRELADALLRFLGEVA